jgi:hypothetical protein
MKTKLISMTDGLNLFNTDDGYIVLNHLGYILKSSKTIYPCLKFIRAEEKFEIAEFEVLYFHTCGRMLIDNQPPFKFSLENALNYKRI